MSAAAILAIDPLMVGDGRLVNAMMATITATATAAINTGTTGGRVHLALSNSSDIGVCPIPGCWAGAAAGAADGIDGFGAFGCWGGFGSSGMAVPQAKDTT